MTLHLVDACGTRRRLQALAAAGHDAVTIVTAMGRAPTARTLVFQWRHPDRRVIAADTAAAVTAVYSRLAHTRGSNPTARIRALKAGFRPAAAWAGLDIDDPDTTPRTEHNGAPTPVDQNGNEAA